MYPLKSHVLYPFNSHLLYLFDPHVLYQSFLPEMNMCQIHSAGSPHTLYPLNSHVLYPFDSHLLHPCDQNVMYESFVPVLHICHIYVTGSSCVLYPFDPHLHIYLIRMWCIVQFCRKFTCVKSVGCLHLIIHNDSYNTYDIYVYMDVHIGIWTHVSVCVIYMI